MLKHITVPIIVDDHDKSKCGDKCQFHDKPEDGYCNWFEMFLCNHYRCKQCLEEAK